MLRTWGRALIALCVLVTIVIAGNTMWCQPPAVNSPVLDVLKTPVSGTDQFTVNNGTVSKTFELDSSGVATIPGVIPIKFSSSDTRQAVAQEIAVAVNAALVSGKPCSPRTRLGPR